MRAESHRRIGVGNDAGWAEERSGAGANGAGIGMRSLQRPGQELVDELKAYLLCRSSGVDPPLPLAEAWEGFYGYYSPRIRTFLKKWALSEADRNDCLQEFWQEVVAGLGHFAHDPGRACLSTWLMTLARNKAVDAIRRRSRHAFESLGEGEATAVMDPGPDPADAYERSWIQGQVRRALAELSSRVSPTSFQVLYLRWMEGRTTSEVAHALELTPEQVRFRTHRMKRKFRDLLERSMIRDTRREADEKNDRMRNGTFPPGE
jgi:RNA polymerase sigma-70 factor, ECF subfamily